MNSNNNYGLEQSQSDNGIVDQQNTMIVDPFVSSNMDNVETFEEPVIEQILDVNVEEKRSHKKLIIILILSFFVLAFGATCLVVFSHPKKIKLQKRETPEDMSFSGIVERANKDGTLDEEVKSALKKKNIEVDKVSLAFVDFDSDNQLELLVYANDEKGHYLLTFEVDDTVLFDDFFTISSIKSIAYVYSVEKNDIYWCCENKMNYTILQDRKLVIKEEDFFKSYYIVSQYYKEQLLVDNMVEYLFGSDLDASKLPQITKEAFFEDHQLTKESLKTKVDEYFKEKNEKEQKEKEEELKTKEMEEQKKDIFDLNGVLLHYGTYKEDTSSSLGNFLINRDGTCMIGNIECSWSFVTFNFGNGDEKAILIKYGDKEKYVSSWASNRISDKKNWNLTYQG